jgi:DNA-directed RNA polymerase subunit alpha
LFTIQDDREVSMELFVNKGRGYVESEMHSFDRSFPIDLVRIDAIYNPVRRANFTVSETRVGQRTDFDRLAVSVETDGTITPEDAIAYAAALVQEHFRFFVEFGKVPQATEVVVEEPVAPVVAANTVSGLAASLTRDIDDLGLSMRSLNSLKNSNIRTLRQLVEQSIEELHKVKNVGDKALLEIAEMLVKEELNFAMKFEEVDGDLRIVEQGLPPLSVVGNGEDA